MKPIIYSNGYCFEYVTCARSLRRRFREKKSPATERKKKKNSKWLRNTIERFVFGVRGTRTNYLILTTTITQRNIYFWTYFPNAEHSLISTRRAQNSLSLKNLVPCSTCRIPLLAGAELDIYFELHDCAWWHMIANLPCTYDN